VIKSTVFCSHGTSRHGDSGIYELSDPEASYAPLLALVNIDLSSQNTYY
jgi:hypothetical protein